MIEGKNGHPEKDPLWNAWGIDSTRVFKDFVSAIQIDEQVFKDVRQKFDIIKKLLLYSYYEREFIDVAFDQSLLTFEMALARRYLEIEGVHPKSKRNPDRDMGLQDMLKWGSRKLLFEDEKWILRSIRNLRNRAAHPRTHEPFGYLVLDQVARVADNINGLYDDVALRRNRRRLKSSVNRSFKWVWDEGAALEIDGKPYIIFFASLMHYENRTNPRMYHFVFWPIFDPSKCGLGKLDTGTPIVVACNKHSAKGPEHILSDTKGTRISIKKLMNPSHVEKYKDWRKFFDKFNDPPLRPLIDIELSILQTESMNRFFRRS